MRKYKALLFDNDGTLVDTEKCILESVKHVFDVCLDEQNPDLEEFKTLIGLPTNDQFAHYTDDQEKVEEMTATYRAHNINIIDEMSENFEGLPEVLAELKRRGYFMGIVTSKRHTMCQKGLDTLGLDGIFEYIQGNEDWHVHKPEPGAMTHACEQISLDPKDVVYIGDSVFDMKSANGAGCDTCAVT